MKNLCPCGNLTDLSSPGVVSYSLTRWNAQEHRTELVQMFCCPLGLTHWARWARKLPLMYSEEGRKSES